MAASNARKTPAPRKAAASSRAEPRQPLFTRFARFVERQVGRSSTFVLAVGVVVVWAASGPLFDWSDTWQLVINTGTTIITFLMVFVIQNTQSRDTEALHLKLNELIRVGAARNALLNLEDMPDEEIERLKAVFQRLGGAGTDAAGECPPPKPSRKSAA
jgi:low affinity Fe/Cu permease